MVLDSEQLASLFPKTDSTLTNSKATDKVSFADKDGQFRRVESKFRQHIPSDKFPAERDRYVLYINYSCPWAHRANLVRCLKGLEDVIQLIEVDSMDPRPGKGWYFSGTTGPEQDPLYGGKYLRDLYERADPGYEGRVTVPTLWDKKNETIVNNESSEIIRFLSDAFDDMLPPEKREANKGTAALLPSHLREEIDALNAWVYNDINNGVYKVGFGSTQESYDQNITPLFAALDRVEEHLGIPAHQPYLFGEHITEADIRLYTTIVRFDVAYYTLFRCNLKMIRHDYPRIHEWLRTLYWDESERTNGGAFMNTTKFALIKAGYSRASQSKVVPAGPVPDILPL
ncbi:glutathione transferase [Saccharata proteae CBS 121410]|uniref:Glutathione transferase n=1 Tax=Saccharata proteae CBS 121410 TaxID=1314787 RepID=A0A9P4LZH3_9PEZI|nr:glutathione transferase [Saccharata proteae CBS 121410]